MSCVDLFLRLQALDLLFVYGLRGGFGNTITDILVVIRITQRAPPMIFESAWEARRRGQAILLGRLGQELILDYELQEHAAPVGGRILRKLSTHFGGSEVEIGLLDVGAIDGGDDNVVSSGSRKRGTSN